MPSNYKFTDGNIVRNFDDIFVTRDSFDTTAVGGPGNFTVSGQDIEDYFIDDQTVIDNFIGDTLWTWGGGGNGQLGNNTTNTVYTPITTFSGGINWEQISVSTHSVAIKSDGTLWTWGYNTSTNGIGEGQLGDNTGTSKITPITTFLGGNNWKQASAGGRTTTNGHTAAIKTDGTLWVWGINAYAQLGTNSSALTFKRTPVTTFIGGTDWRQVSCGGRHTMAIKTDGSLWTWGFNTYGQLGTFNRITRSTPVTTFLGGNNWKTCSAGTDHSMAIKTDGTLWVWGRGNDGRLANGTQTRSIPVQTTFGGTDWKTCSAGTFNSAAIKTDGTLWLWGSASSGMLGNNATSPTPIITPITTFLGGNNWKQVECGYRATSAIKTDGTLWTWGSQTLGGGNLGINVNGGTRLTPVTTFRGGNNWKQVVSGEYTMNALTSGLTVDLS